MSVNVRLPPRAIQIAALGALALAAVGYLSRWHEETSAPSGVDTQTPAPQVSAQGPRPAQAKNDVPQIVQESHADSPAPVSIEKLAQDAVSGSPQVRGDALAALAVASKPEALPILRRVVMSGEPSVDRPLALRALRDLALNQGDGDQRVRDVVREVVYHSDDEALQLAAQEVLDMIEESELE